MVCKSKLLVVLAFLLGAGHVLAGIVPVSKVFHAGSEQTSDRLIFVGGSEDGGLLAIDTCAEFMVARDENNVALNWCNAGTFKWSFGFFGFDGDKSEYPKFEADVSGFPALTFDGGDKLRMILEPGYGYKLPESITDGVLSVEIWVLSPKVSRGEVLVSFEDKPGFELKAADFKLRRSSKWQYLVAVSDGKSVAFYKNGKIVGTKPKGLIFGGDAVINLGAKSFSGSMTAFRVHTEKMTGIDIAHNYKGGPGLGSYLFYPMKANDPTNSFWGDPEQCDELTVHESAHCRSMYKKKENPNLKDDISKRIVEKQLPAFEEVYTYLNERSGKHLPFVSSAIDKRGDGRKYKWLVGNGWGGAWSGSSPMGLGYGISYTGGINPHEYIHGSDGHQMNIITGQWWEAHANFQVSWLGNPQVNPATQNAIHAHVYPTTGGNYYHSYLIWDHLVESEEFGGLYVTRLWNMGKKAGKNRTVFPPAGMALMDPSPETPFAEEWVKMAARNITWDYPRHPEYAKNWKREPYKVRRFFTRLEEVSYLQDGWYEAPKWRTPQQHGYNICPLEVKAGTVTADLKGFIDPVHKPEWSAMFVAVSDGKARYGDVFTTAKKGSFKVLGSDDELYLVVVATPEEIMDIGIFSHDPLCDYRGAPKDRFPYQVKLTGTEPKGSLWVPEAGIKGEVAESAYVSPTAFIGPGAKILDNGRVEGYAKVYGTVKENGIVSGYAVIEKGATVSGNGRVGDYAVISNGSTVTGNARVLEHACIKRGKLISDYAVCKGNAYIDGPVHGNGMIDGNYIKNNDVDKGVWFQWSWGSGKHHGEVDEDFSGLFCEYKFEKQNGYRVWDTHGCTWARLINGVKYVDDNGGKAVEFNGDDQFIELHNSVATGIDTSITVDVKWDGGSDERIFEFSNGKGDVCWLSPSDRDGKLSFGIRVGRKKQVAQASKALPKGEWVNVKFVTYDDIVILLVNDEEWARNEKFSNDVEDVRANACYLGRGESGKYFGGRMDNFTVWSRSLVDVVAPTPNPAAFYAVPASVSETEVTMVSVLGADTSGNVEYLFEEMTNNAGATDSEWISEREFRNKGLRRDVAEYAYRVTMRDKSGNVTEPSAVTRLAWKDVDVYPVSEAGLAVVEAENFTSKVAGIKGGIWELDTKRAGYVGSGAINVPSKNGRNYGKNYPVQSPRADYFIDFAKKGKYWIWVRAFGSNPNADSYHLGLDMKSGGWGEYQAWGLHNVYLWLKKGPFKIDEPGVHTINLWMREDGTRVDRFVITSDNDYVPCTEKHNTGVLIGKGPVETGVVSKKMLISD